MRILNENNTLVQTALKLEDARKITETAYQNQAEEFYTTLLEHPEWIAPLKEFSISEEILREDLMVLKELKAATISKNTESKEAQAALGKRDEALEQLFDWTGRYKKVARLALRGNKELLGLLGL